LDLLHILKYQDEHGSDGFPKVPLGVPLDGFYSFRMEMMILIEVADILVVTHRRSLFLILIPSGNVR
jgi:hypothetical protein